MSEQLGILTKEQESLLGSKIDELLDFKKFKGLSVLELVDGYFFTTAIRFVDDQYAEMLGEPYKTVATEFVAAMIASDWEKVADLAADLVDSLVDIPLIDGEEEHMFIISVVQVAVQLIGSVASRKAPVV
jgi:hypothetical protein